MDEKSLDQYYLDLQRASIDPYIEKHKEILSSLHEIVYALELLLEQDTDGKP